MHSPSWVGRFQEWVANMMLCIFEIANTKLVLDSWGVGSRVHPRLAAPTKHLKCPGPIVLPAYNNTGIERQCAGFERPIT